MTHQASTTRRDLLKHAGGAAMFAALGAIGTGAARAAAPMLGVLRPQVHRFKLGSFEITNILDGFRIGDGPHPIFGNNQTVETVQAYAKEYGLSPTKLETVFVNTVVNTGKELVLFDTGNGKGRMPTAGNLVEGLAAAGYKPEQIDIVVVTHGHPDHIGGLMADGKPVYAKCSATCSSISGRRETSAMRKRPIATSSCRSPCRSPGPDRACTTCRSWRRCSDRPRSRRWDPCCSRRSRPRS